MSPATGLELDFGFGSLYDGSHTMNGLSAGTNNPLASTLSEFGTGASNGASAADFLSLSSLFDSSSGNVNGVSSNNNNGAPNASWQQTKKNLLDQQQQQLQQEQNSLNALLSQHTASSSGNAVTAGATSSTSSTPNPFGFATREELESLAASASAAASASSNNQQNQQTSYAQVQQSSTTAGINNASNNYMFVATIVDPNQEDAPPQQMLFLPGSNQVIPMPSSFTTGASNPMMALANFPVVFPQGNNSGAAATSTNGSSAENNVSATANWSSRQTQQLQLNGLSSGLNSLEDAFSSAQAQALAPAPFDFHQHSSLAQLPALKPAIASSTTPAPEAAAAAANKAAMPVRPLSAYNFFFSDERERILQNKTDENDVFDNAKKQRLLLAHLAKDRSKRRPHRKTHGKINFTTLSKLIGQRWKQLPDERKNFYREVAAIDLERYQRELRERSPPNAAAAGADFCT